MRARAILLCAGLLAVPVAAAGQPSAPETQAATPDGLTRLVLAIEYSIRTGDGAALRALALPSMNRVRLSEFALAMTQTKARARDA